MLTAGVAAGLVGACDLRPPHMSSNNGDDENPDCAWEGDAALDEELQEDAPALELGFVDTDGEYSPWTPGSEVSIVMGGQGLEMVTPTVRVVGPPDLDETCLHVSIEMRYAGETGEDSAVAWAENAYEFRRDGDDLLAGPIWVPFDVWGVDDDFDTVAVVTAGEWQSVLELTVHANAT